MSSARELYKYAAILLLLAAIFLLSSCTVSIVDQPLFVDSYIPFEVKLNISTSRLPGEDIGYLAIMMPNFWSVQSAVVDLEDGNTMECIADSSIEDPSKIPPPGYHWWTCSVGSYNANISRNATVTIVPYTPGEYNLSYTTGYSVPITWNNLDPNNIRSISVGDSAILSEEAEISFNVISCMITDAYWSDEVVSAGTEVTLTVEGTDICNGKTINFEIFEDDITGDENINDKYFVSSSAVFHDGKAVSHWNAIYEPDGLPGLPRIFDPPEYYFIATIADDPSVSTRSLGPGANGLLFVQTNQPPEASEPFLIDPNGGKTYNNSVEINWSPAVDPENDTVVYHLYYSDDSGATWKDPIVQSYGYLSTTTDGKGSKTISFEGTVCGCPDVPYASETCEAGACSLTCDADHDDCDALFDNGCEVYLADDMSNCGECGNACPEENVVNAVMACSAGSCLVQSCIGDYHDIDGIPSNGCEYECMPTGVEECDNIDNDCDGNVDEMCDNDQDGWCDLTMTVVGNPDACIYGAGDCNDNDASVNPGAAEICDNNDNDCDAGTADGSGETWYQQQTTCGVGECTGNTGTYECVMGVQTDTCNPEEGAIAESCDDDTGYDGLDNNCDGTPDLDCSAYCDEDGDGYTSHLVCIFTPGGECDDSNANINPSAAESCNGVDDNCDGYIDEGCDEDNDGYCNQAMSIDPSTASCLEFDCDDLNPDINSGAVELCDGIDNNCDSAVDENCP